MMNGLLSKEFDIREKPTTKILSNARCQSKASIEAMSMKSIRNKLFLKGKFFLLRILI
jgi:hypothetical protein